MSGRPDLIRVRHYTVEVQPNGYGCPYCATPGRRLNVTDDKSRVTCKMCKKRLAREDDRRGR